MATVLDEIMVWACAVATRQFAFCAELNVRYLQPLIARRGSRGHRRTGGESQGPGLRGESGAPKRRRPELAEATGKYLPIKNVEVSETGGGFRG